MLLNPALQYNQWLQLQLPVNTPLTPFLLFLINETKTSAHWPLIREHTHIHICTHTYIHVHTHTRTHTSTHTHLLYVCHLRYLDLLQFCSRVCENLRGEGGTSWGRFGGFGGVGGFSGSGIVRNVAAGRQRVLVWFEWNRN